MCFRKVACLMIATALVSAGCNKKTGEYKTADKPGKVKLEHHQGARGGVAFDVGEGHKYMAELIVKDKKIEIYLIDHHDKEKKKPVFTTDKEITITGIEHDKKKHADITLKAAPLKDEKDKWSHFEAAAPEGVDEAHVLDRAQFSVTIDGKKQPATIEAEEHDHKD